jgi:hypothetical protein
MKQLYDLFDFDEIEIKTRQDSYDHVYTARIKKHMTFEMFDEREYLPTKEEWIEKAKETFVKKIISDHFIHESDEDDAKYFIDLKNALENTGLVDQFLWDRGYKRLGSKWQPKSISHKQSSIEWLFVELWNTPKDKFDWQSIFEQAKLMHREDMGKTWDSALDRGQERAWNVMRAYGDFDEYYTETFGGQDNE